MLATALALTLLAAPPDDDAGVPAHYDEGPLPTDGRVIDFFPDAGLRPLEPAWLRLRGNRVLPEELYRHALALPSDAQPDAQTAAYIEETLYGFLVKNGYELATVGAVVRDDGIDVQIDEGQLEKIVFTGRLTWQTLRFRLELGVDQDVFNRPALERQIAEVSKRVGLPVVKWSLVPTANPDHIGPQLRDVPAIEGVELFRARKRYELRFYFQEAEWGEGLGVDLRSGYIDGLEVGLNYQGFGLVHDQWRVAASAGLGLRFDIIGHSLYPAFSRAFAEARWYAPKIGRVHLGVWLTANLFARQRADLFVENYNEASAIASVHAAIDLLPSMKLIPTIGAQWRKIFGIVVPPPFVGMNVIPSESERVRTFVELRLESIVDPDNERWDRMHWLDVGARYYFGRALSSDATGYLSYGWVYEHYRKVFQFGWHDLWIRSNARFAFGDVQFHDELSLGEVLRGVFGGTFVRKGFDASAEFQFSLSRDVLKVALYAEGGAWGELYRRPAEVEVLNFGLSGGPAVHALIQGMFQLDVYGAIGVRKQVTPGTSPLGFGLVVWLNKVF